MKVAALFDNFGPYHIVRLNSASQILDIVGVELAPSSIDYAWVREETSIVFERTSLLRSRPTAEVRLLSLYKLLSSALTRIGPDVIAVPGWTHLGVVAAIWGWRNRVPLVLMSESGHDDAQRVFWKEWMKRVYVKRFRCALVGGQRHVEYLKRLGMKSGCIFLGYDAIDNEYFCRHSLAAGASQPPGRNGHSLPKNFFLASSRFIEKKNLLRLLEAYSRYRRIGSKEPWDLILLGDGAMRPEIEATCLQLGITDNVHLPGFKQYQDLPTYYGSAKCFVHASTVEQWGLVVNEAMASGLPVIVSRQCGCSPDLVNDGSNGFTFDAYNIDDLTDRMQSMAALSEEERATMGVTSRKMIAEWGPQRFATGLKQACDAAVAG